MDPRAHMPPPRGNIHVHLHNIQTSSPLKPLGQSKPNFEASLGWGNQCIINNPGHMTNMAVMPIYGKNPSKILLSGTSEPISTKLITQVLQCVYKS